MKKIYYVYDACSSEILYYFSTRELAQKYMDFLDDPDNTELFEADVDNPVAYKRENGKLIEFNPLEEVK